MKRRILKITICAICFPLIFPAVLLIPVFAIYAIVKYIITGKDDIVDVVFYTMEFTVKLPYDIIDKLKL